MANYYTTRFNPALWPPADGAVPAGVTSSEESLRARGQVCCIVATLEDARAEPTAKRWTYRVTYRVACTAHGAATIQETVALDWVSPNEYLLDD